MNTKLLHVCFSSFHEVMFRTHEDYIRGINDLVIASARTGTTILAYVFMSNHAHCCIQTSANPYDLYRIWRISYGRYFSAKYGRSGYIGDSKLTVVEIEGYQHCITAISYCLRNPLHHGVTNSCLDYRYSSVHAYFRKSMGLGPFPVQKRTCPRRLAPANAERPKWLTFDSDGRASLEVSVDFKQVEFLFKTPNEFAFNMQVRRSGKKWRDDQSEDGNDLPPVTLEMLESDVFIVHEMEKNERLNFNVTAMPDIDVCEIIDNDIVPKKYGKDSVYSLTLDEKLSVARYFHSNFSCSVHLLARCLAVRDDSFFRLFYKF